MTNAQRATADALGAMLPGADWHADLYTLADGDAIYGDGSVLVHFMRPKRGDELTASGRRRVVGFDTLGSVRIGSGGYVIAAHLGPS